MVPSIPERGPSLIVIEGSLTAVAIAVAFCWPRFGSRYFAIVERFFVRLAHRKRLAVATVGAMALLLRLAILPLSPIPRPFILDAFSYLLAGDTFASGRLSNPTPAMWMHFESFQINMQPTYMSMYFPAQGMVLAAGKVLAGHPWYGLLLCTALMCAAICWMLQAWLPPTWALLGGMLAVLRLGLFSYWINTYSGGGSVAALGGALVLGAFPRFIRSVKIRDGLLLAAGFIILANSRPYEGILLSLPVCLVLGRWIFSGNRRISPALMLRRTAAPLLLIIAAGAWMGYYNYRVFGSPLTPPYKTNRATYAIAPHFAWQPQRQEPVFRHAVMREFYSGWELNAFRKVRTTSGFLTETPLKLVRAIVFFAGVVLLLPLIMLRRVLLDRRIRFLLISLIFLAVGMLLETWLIPHYLSPFTAVFYAMGLQGMRHLRLWRPAGQPTGLALVRFIVTICIVMTGLRTWAEPLHLRLAAWPTLSWYGAGDFGVPRARVAAALNQLPGKQLAIVRYSPGHNPLDEWVYNAADIDHSRIVWAREMGGTEDLELIRYYQDRKVWLVQPDKTPAEVSLYTDPMQETVASR
jgi:hypothetical protein